VGPKPVPVPVCVWGVGHLHQARNFLERSLRALAVCSKLELSELWAERKRMKIELRRLG